MKLLFGALLVIGGLCGAAMSFLCKIVVNSSLPIFDGLELSIALGSFFVVAFLSGIHILVSTD